MRTVSIDTETHRDLPFIATVTDDQLNSRLYDLKIQKDYNDLQKLCADPNVIKIMHPVTYDAYCLDRVGIPVVPPYRDTMVEASLVNENYKSRKLKELARVYLGEKCEEEALLKKVKAKYKALAKKAGVRFSYAMIPAEVLRPYALQDSVYTIKLHYYFKQPISEFHQLYEFELELIPIILGMEKRGFLVDRQFVKDQIVICERELKLINQRLRNYLIDHGCDPNLNLGSPKQIGAVIEKLGIPIRDITKKGDVSTKLDVLMDHLKHPFIRLVVESRFYSKQLSTYYYPLRDEYTREKDPIAHFFFWQSGAKTGRFSADLIQTIPKRKEKIDIGAKTDFLRKAFIPRPGYVLVSFDYDQIEMRIFAHVSGAKKMIRKILDGFDPHLGTAMDLFGKHILKLSPDKQKEFRRIAKTINFGIIFGMGMNKLKKSLGLTDRRAWEILDNYFDQYPVKEYMRKITGMLYKTGVITLSYASRLMSFVRHYRVPQDKAYKGVNVIVQGTAAYCLKYAMKRVDTVIKQKKLNAELLICVHDELVFEIWDDHRLDSTIQTLGRAMVDNVTFAVPLTVTCGISRKSWGDLEDYPLKEVV